MMMRVSREELARIKRENAKMRSENHVLRCALKNLEKNPYMECRDVLKAVSGYCLEKYRSENARRGPLGPPYICPDGCPPCKELKDEPTVNYSENRAESQSPENDKIEFINFNDSRMTGSDDEALSVEGLEETGLNIDGIIERDILQQDFGLEGVSGGDATEDASALSEDVPPPAAAAAATTRDLVAPRGAGLRGLVTAALTQPGGWGLDRSHNNASLLSEDRKKPADGLSVRGCAQGPCGGYTPSGWNKLRSMGLLDDQKDMLPEDPIPGTSDNKEAASGANVAAAKVGGDAGAEGSKFRPSARLLGEMAFQLERRILDYVFGLEGSKRRRFYGYTVNNICYMMEKESTNPEGGSDVVGRTEMTCRLRKILCALEKYGYDIKIHADFSQEIINKYGLLPSPPDERTVQLLGLNDPCTVSCLAARLVKRQSELHNLNILLNCLHFLSKCDGRPLFVW